jgi:hypothetical protein
MAPGTPRCPAGPKKPPEPPPGPSVGPTAAQWARAVTASRAGRAFVAVRQGKGPGGRTAVLRQTRLPRRMRMIGPGRSSQCVFSDARPASVSDHLSSSSAVARPSRSKPANALATSFSEAPRRRQQQDGRGRERFQQQ